METKWCWHIHHNLLLEVCEGDIKDRIDYIKNNKPEEEIEIRLRLLKPVKGKLPSRLLKAREVYDKDREACVKAQEACAKAREACVKARETCVKAREAYDKAWEAYDKAWEAYNKAEEVCAPQIEILHAKECPNCPWNGKTIFPK